MKDFAELFQQIYGVQDKLSKVRQRLAEIEVVGESGGGMVVAVLGGDGTMRRLELRLEAECVQNAKLIEELVVAAHNDARRKLDNVLADEMSRGKP